MDIDDLVNGLPVKSRPKLGNPVTAQSVSTPSHKRGRQPMPPPRRRQPPSPEPEPPPPPEPEPPPPFEFKYYRVPRWFLWTLLCCVAGFVWADLLGHDDGHGKAPPLIAASAASATPAATVTVTVTKTVEVEVLPESCRQVMVLMRDLLDDMNMLNAKSATQIDIASEANIAIYQKDWAKLRDVQERQRQLTQVQEPAYQDFKLKMQPALDAMAQCEKDGK